MVKHKLVYERELVDLITEHVVFYGGERDSELVFLYLYRSHSDLLGAVIVPVCFLAPGYILPVSRVQRQ
jgi:hypothetical protein